MSSFRVLNYHFVKKGNKRILRRKKKKRSEKLKYREIFHIWKSLLRNIFLGIVFHRSIHDTNKIAQRPIDTFIYDKSLWQHSWNCFSAYTFRPPDLYVSNLASNRYRMLMPSSFLSFVLSFISLRKSNLHTEVLHGGAINI